MAVVVRRHRCAGASLGLDWLSRRFTIAQLFPFVCVNA